MKESMLSRVRKMAYVGKKFKIFTEMWEVEAAIKSLPHKEQKFVCVHRGSVETKGMTVPISYLRRTRFMEDYV
jgi:hypothetical protein